MRKLDIDIPDKYLIDAVIGGVTDENVARTIRSAQHCNANELYAYMTTLGSLPSKNERNKTASYSRNDRKDRAPKTSPASQSSVTNDENVKPTSDKTVAENEVKSRVECYNCGKSGHIARKCRMPCVKYH